MVGYDHGKPLPSDQVPGVLRSDWEVGGMGDGDWELWELDFLINAVKLHLGHSIGWEFDYSTQERKMGFVIYGSSGEVKTVLFLNAEGTGLIAGQELRSCMPHDAAKNFF